MPTLAVVVVAALATLAAGGASAALTRPFQLWLTASVHGALRGHAHNATLDATYADLLAFRERLAELRAGDSPPVDVLAFDAGAPLLGSGLSDASAVHGELVYPVVARLNYTAAAAGAADVRFDASVAVLARTIERFFVGGRYVTGNVVYRGTQRTLGAPVHVHTAAHSGASVLVLGHCVAPSALRSQPPPAAGADPHGVHPDDAAVAPSLTLLSAAEAVQLPSFRAAVRFSHNLIVLLAHADPVADRGELRTLYDAVRRERRSTPFVIVAGRAPAPYHERYDPYCFVVSPGARFEHVALARFDLGAFFDHWSVEFAATSVRSLRAAAGYSGPAHAWRTPFAHQVQERLDEDAAALRLNDTLACAPRTFDVDVPTDDAATSLHALYVAHMASLLYVFDPARQATPVLLASTDSLRAPLHAGAVTRDDVYAAAPLVAPFRAFERMRGDVANALVDALRKLAAPRAAGGHAWLLDPAALPLDASRPYDVVLAEHDARRAAAVLQRVAPDGHWQHVPYAGRAPTDTALLELFVTQAFPCAASGRRAS